MAMVGARAALCAGAAATGDVASIMQHLHSGDAAPQLFRRHRGVLEAANGETIDGEGAEGNSAATIDDEAGSRPGQVASELRYLCNELLVYAGQSARGLGDVPNDGIASPMPTLKQLPVALAGFAGDAAAQAAMLSVYGEQGLGLTD